MRQIGEIGDKEQARRFVAHLITLGISTSVELEGEEWEVWVKDEDRVDEATQELESFLANPEDKKYSQAISKATELEREREKKQREIQKNIRKISDARTSQQRPLTILLIVISAIVGLMTNFGEGTGKDSQVYKTMTFLGISGADKAITVLDAANGNRDDLKLTLASITNGEVWRLVTPIFIHYGTTHIIFNMWCLFVLGVPIENRYGTFKFGLIILFAAAISNFAQAAAPERFDGSVAYFDGANLMLHFGGMSGVVYALFGFIWMKSTYDRSSGLRISSFTVVLLLGWLFLCMTPAGEQMIGRVANWAHGVGLVVGMIAGLLPIAPRGIRT